MALIKKSMLSSLRLPREWIFLCTDRKTFLLTKKITQIFASASERFFLDVGGLVVGESGHRAVRVARAPRVPDVIIESTNRPTTD